MAGIAVDRRYIETEPALGFGSAEFGAPLGTTPTEPLSAAPEVDPEFETLLAQSSIRPIVPMGRVLGILAD